VKNDVLNQENVENNGLNMRLKQKLARFYALFYNITHMSHHYTFDGNWGSKELPPNSCFKGLSEEEIDTHCAITHYGQFHLTGAVFPSYDLQVVPTEGFRYDCCKENNMHLPCITAAVTRAKIFELFLRCLKQLKGNEWDSNPIDVVLETSHKKSGHHTDVYFSNCDTVLLPAILRDYQQLPEEDGATGIAALVPHTNSEVQFDEHKNLVCYGTRIRQLIPFENILEEAGVPFNAELRCIMDVEHLHSSSDGFKEQFAKLAKALEDVSFTEETAQES